MRWIRIATGAFLPVSFAMAWIGSRAQLRGAMMWLVVGVGLFGLSWVHPQSPASLALSAVVIAALAVVSQSWIVGVAGAFLLAAIAWRTYGPARVLVDIEEATVLPAGTVAEGAERHVGEFEERGWTHSSALSVPIGKMELIATLMLSPDKDSFAEITDVVISISSAFDHSRQLVTRNSAITGLPPTFLANDLRGASAAELIEAHRHALGILAELGERPLPLQSDSIAERTIAGERLLAAWLRANPTRKGTGIGAGPVDRSSRSARRIEGWLDRSAR